MDTSKEYILMCQKTEEIQNLRPLYRDWEDGDYYIEPVFGKKFQLKIAHNPDWGPGEHIGSEMFIPRQDQLQEMLKQRFSLIYNMINEFYFWCEDNAGSYTWDSISSSMEQLWLTFVMHELYEKYWTGSEWEAYK